MPPYNMLNKAWLKDIFAGKKRLLKLKDVNRIAVPKYDEVSVKGLYDKLLNLKGMKDYFPDKYAKGRTADREYMFNIANTLHQNIVEEVVCHALN